MMERYGHAMDTDEPDELDPVLVADELEERGFGKEKAHEVAEILVEYDRLSVESDQRRLSLARVGTLLMGGLAIGVAVATTVTFSRWGYLTAAIPVVVAALVMVSISAYRWWLLYQSRLRVDLTSDRLKAERSHARRLALIAALPKVEYH